MTYETGEEAGEAGSELLGTRRGGRFMRKWWLGPLIAASWVLAADGGLGAREEENKRSSKKETEEASEGREGKGGEGEGEGEGRRSSRGGATGAAEVGAER